MTQNGKKTSINQTCCRVLDLNLFQMSLLQSNTCSLCSPNTLDDCLCAIWHRPTTEHFSKEITNKQSNILDFCIHIFVSLRVPDDHTAASAHRLTAVTLIPLTVAKRNAASGCMKR